MSNHGVTPGAIVRARHRDWVVLPSADPDIVLLRPLAGDETEVAGIYVPLLTAGVERIDPATFPAPDPARVGDFVSARLLWNAARLSLRAGAGPFRSLARLSVRPRAYQYVPLLMALRQDPVRLLIADDVGVGKTIEAGLIARELLDRGEIGRICVLCPPYLAEQWHAELATKFHIHAEVIRAGTAARLERRLPPGAHSIFAHHRHLVVSIDYAKSERHRLAFLAHCPDFVIVDEAHGVAGGGLDGDRMQRHRLVRSVAERPGRHLLLLTATPHSGYEASFRALLGLLHPALGAESALATDIDPDAQGTPTPGADRDAGSLRVTDHVIQRRRADVANWVDDTTFPERVSIEETYALSPDYYSLFADVYGFVHGMVQAGEGMSRWAQRLRYFAALALLRCVMSSPAAAVATLRARIDDPASAGREPDGVEEAPPNGADSEVDLDEAVAAAHVYDEDPEEVADDSAPTSVAQSVRTFMSANDRRTLKDFARRAEALAGSDADTKVVKLTQIVAGLLDHGDHPIVWCRYIATSDYVASELARRLARRGSGVRVVSVTGQISDDERRARIAELVAEPRRVLVATDCLSEGVNLQDHFSSVVHYDLPWNPNRLEQREGRVDRFGQPRRKVQAVLLYGNDNPIDGAVFEVLLRKAREIFKALGTYVPVPVNSQSVMEAILQALFLRASKVPAQLPLSAVQGLDLSKLHVDWDREVERERQTRTRFTQPSIRPDVVAAAVLATDSVLGDPTSVITFVRDACQRLGVSVRPGQATRRGAVQAGYGTTELAELLIPVEELPDAVRVRLPTTASPLRIAFDQPVSEGATPVGRNHPLVAGLAAYILESALENQSAEIPVAARTAVVRTAAVRQRTTVMILRLRHLLEPAEDKPTMLVEEVRLRAYTGAHPSGAWLEEADVASLLADARPSAVVGSGERSEFLADALALLDAVKPDIQAYIQTRAQAVAEQHREFRAVTGLGKVVARPHEAPDVLGLYVLLPPGPLA